MIALSRDEMLAAMLAHRAVAAELERRLKDANCARFEKDRSVETWRFDGIGVVAAKTTNDAVAVVDQAAFLAYVQDTHPGEVVMVPKLRNQQWADDVLLPGLTPVPPVDVDGEWKPAPGAVADVVDRDGRIVPGVAWRKGGAFLNVAITPDSTYRKQLTVAAQDALERGVPMPGLLDLAAGVPVPTLSEQVAS